MMFVGIVLSTLGIAAAMLALSWWGYGAVAGAGRRPLGVFEPLPLARAAAARLVGALLPLLVPFLLFVGVLLVQGQPVSTTRVKRVSGPALAAGMQTGDRVLGIDGLASPTWDSVRAGIRAIPDASGAHEVELERDGQRLTLSVVPNDGRIGIESIEESQPVSLLAAATKAVGLSTSVLRELVVEVVGREREALQGPIGIVRESSPSEHGAAQQLGDSAWACAAFATWFVPALLLLHLVDGVSLRRFVFANPESMHDEDRRSEWRVARCRQLLISVTIGWLVLGLLALGLGGSPKYLVYGGNILTVPLAWIVARATRGRLGSILYVLGLIVPLLNWFLVAVLAQGSRVFLQNRGIRAAWFRHRAAA